MIRRSLVSTLVFATALAGLSLRPALAAQWYVAPDGTPAGQGTPTAPWDLTSALAGQRPIAPGDTLWVRGGLYQRPYVDVGYGYPVQLVGTAAAPILIRAFPGEHVLIDGGLNILPPSTDVWFQDLDVFVSEPRPPQPVPPDPTYDNVNRPFGGISVNTGSGFKFIDLAVHDNNEGINFWNGAHDSDIYGCVIYDNGWQGTDRGHGHAIYTQNSVGTKTISDCIMTGGYGYTIHAYGSPAATIANYRIEGNMVYRANTFLVGGESPARNITVRNNYLDLVLPNYYFASMQIGYPLSLLGSPTPFANGSCDVENNIIDYGTLSIANFQQPIALNNLVVNPFTSRPRGTTVILRPNQYDPNRANLGVYHWSGRPNPKVDVSGFLHPGDRYRLMLPTRTFGCPVETGIYRGKPIRVPELGEFTAYVMLRDAPTTAPTDLSATAVSDSQIDLSLSNNAGKAADFTVYRSTDGVSFAPIGASEDTKFTDTGLSPSTNYYYRVSGRIRSRSLGVTNNANSVTLATRPIAPTGLMAAPASSGDIALSWNDNSDNEEVFYVERSSDGLVFTRIAATAANVSDYTDKGLTTGKTYLYRVVAWNNGGYSADSNVVVAAAP
ncbi:MAG TPA: right-handed parallel beta-helix repeat-containing protein [Armatimonadota bacterium]|nr:right-handed parallel beta-helix repeat-containing protein [Armatimonadota bacterium]